MYILDTNALYFYIGREQIGENSDAKVDCESLRKALDRRDDKALASSAYVEAMVKYRNQPEYAEKIHAFMDLKDLCLFNNVQYQTFSIDQMSVNLSLKGDQLSQYIKNIILPQKIDIEVRFATGFLFSILLLYTKYRIDDSKRICSNHDYDIEKFIRDITIRNVIAELYKTLQDAYENYENNEQQRFKDKYIELLMEGCKLSDVLVEVLSTKGTDVSISDIEEVENEIDSKYAALQANKPDNYLMDNIHNVFSSRPDFMDEAKKRFAVMYSKKGKAFKGKEKFAFRPIQVDYIAEEMYSSWMDNSQKFRKNDIFDLFFLGCADYKDNRPVENILIDRSTYLLTFDKKLDRYIERKRPSNGKVIRRFFDDF